MFARHSRIPASVLERRLQDATFKKERENGRIDTIEKQEFIDHTKSIWRFATERASRVNHPAPFPVELPRRCIELYTFTGDVVPDPFNGSEQPVLQPNKQDGLTLALICHPSTAR